jgi:chitin biosynthesis protein CHS5
LEWDPISLSSAEIRSLSLFRNGSKVGSIPKPLDLTTTKISGLAIDTDYTFQLVLRTSAGTFPSNKLAVRTHALTNLSGITITPGLLPSSIKTSVLATAERIGARIADTVRIDTTHFVCTEPRGAAWERARDMNIPVVVPDWLLGCEREGRIVGVRQYYLDADPRQRQMGPSVVTGSQERPRTPQATPGMKITPPTPEQANAPEVPPKDTPRRGSTISERDEDIKEEGNAKEAEAEKEGGREEAEDNAEDKVEAGEKEIDAPKGSDPERVLKKATVEDAKDEDASFHDVAL